MQDLFFCTLFNFDYFAKGILTVRSLLDVCPDAQVYVLAMDDRTYNLLKEEKDNHIRAVSLDEFESHDLLVAKSNRSGKEYCWTCGSAFIYFCMNNFHLPSCIYIDADLFFYASPQILLTEIGNDDVMITEHRYTSQFDVSRRSGKYCVQFMVFKNTPNGMRILKWWRDQCLDWCYDRFEDGKFGDQKYLDDWTDRFEGVHVMHYEGGGLAPWNVQQYELSEEYDHKLIARNKRTGECFDMVFYHFHHLRNYTLNNVNEFRMGPYPISCETKKFVYLPYIKRLIEIYKQYSNSEFDPLGSVQLNLPKIHFLLHELKVCIYPKDKIVWHV